MEVKTWVPCNLQWKNTEVKKTLKVHWISGNHTETKFGVEEFHSDIVNNTFASKFNCKEKD